MNSDTFQLSFYLTTILILVRTVNFCNGQDPEVILYLLTSLSRVGKRDSLLWRRGSGLVKCGRGSHLVLSIVGGWGCGDRMFHVNSFFLVLSVIGIVAVAVHCLIFVSSKLLLSQPVIFVFCAPNLLSIPLQRRVGGESRGAIG